jgi:hypothetical protein
MKPQKLFHLTSTCGHTKKYVWQAVRKEKDTCRSYLHEIVEKSPHKHFEDNMTMSGNNFMRVAHDVSDHHIHYD